MPKPKPIERKTISDAQLHSWFLSTFESGKTGKTDLLGLLRTKYKIGRDRYFKAYDIAYLEWQEARKKADTIQIQANAQESLKSALKTKIDRLLFYQKHIEEMERQANGEVPFTFKVGNKMMNSHNADGKFMAPIEVITMIRDTIKSYQAEVSKMDGDYSTSPTVNVTVENNDIIHVPDPEPLFVGAN